MQSYLLVYFGRFAIEENTRFQWYEVWRLSLKPYLGLYRSHVALYVPRELKRAVDRLAYGDDMAGTIAEPFVESNIHALGGPLHIKVIMFRPWGDGGYACGLSKAKDDETEEQRHTEVQLHILEEQCPSIHGYEAKQYANNQ